MKYLCSFCYKHFEHVQTEDHTPLAELICLPCAKKMSIEVQTHPENSEEDENGIFGC